MKALELSWNSSDNLRFYVKVWEPELAPRAVLCLAHGIGEHINRYNHWASAMAEEGYATIGFDQRGHGQSAGKKGYIASYEILLQDIELLIRKTQERFPNIPVVLFGQSLGGNLVINYLLRMELKPNCAIVSSPWLRLAYDIPAVQEKLGRLLMKVVPGLIQKSNFDVNDLSNDKEVVNQYIADPLVHNRVSLNLGFLSIDAGVWALENANMLTTPLLLMHGDSDKITSLEATSEFAEKSQSFANLKIWENMKHELHNEPEKQKVFNFVLNWMRIYYESEISK